VTSIVDGVPRRLARYLPARALPHAPDLTPDYSEYTEESETGKKLILGGIPCIGPGILRPHDDRSNPLDEVMRNEHNPRRRGPLGYGKANP
jgi:hypothetical protein